MKTAILSILALFLISPVLAQEPTFTPTPTKRLEPTRMERRDEIKKKIEEDREELKKRIEEKKEELEKKRDEMKDEIEKKKEELKKKLEERHDQKKAERITKIQARLVQINAKRTSEMLETVNKLSSRAAVLKTKVDELEKTGVTVTAIRQSLASAEAKIAVAKKAVEDQMKKQYVITVDDPVNDRLNVGKVVSKLQDDLQGVRKLVIEARQSLLDTAKLYSQAKGDAEKERIAEPTKTPEKDSSEITNP